MPFEVGWLSFSYVRLYLIYGMEDVTLASVQLVVLRETAWVLVFLCLGDWLAGATQVCYLPAVR